jgi:surface-anchored protein
MTFVTLRPARRGRPNRRLGVVFCQTMLLGTACEASQVRLGRSEVYGADASFPGDDDDGGEATLIDAGVEHSSSTPHPDTTDRDDAGALALEASVALPPDAVVDAGSGVTRDADSPNAQATADGSAADAAPDCAFSYAAGHGDLYVQYDVEREFSLRVRSELEPGLGELLYDPQDVCIVVPRRARQATVDFGGRPAGTQWEFMGVSAGEPFWLLPQVARADVPWFGTAAASVPPDVISTSALVAELMPPGDALPGAFAAWATDSFGSPQPILSTAMGLTRLVIPPGSHSHLNWSFSAPGRYDLAFKVMLVSDDGALSVTGREQTFRFEVEP